MTNDPGSTGAPGEEPKPATPPTPPPYGQPTPPPQPPEFQAPQPPPSYGTPPQPGGPQYGAPQYGGAPGYGYPAASAGEQKAKTALYVGIAGIVLAFCCPIVGLVLGIVGVVQSNNATALGAPSAQTSRVVSFVAIGLCVASMLFGVISFVSNLN